MYCYKDRTFCASPNCKNECGRQLTQEIRDAAIKASMLIAQSYFCGEKEHNCDVDDCGTGPYNKVSSKIID